MSVPRLGVDEFGDFFRAVHGVEAFPWQRRLATAVCQHGWPDALDVPTGAGKTAAIDIAVFHLAIEADLGVRRTAPVRILFVVDRRLVVDEAYERARRVADALASPGSDVVARVAARLRRFAERPERPLVVGRLRGGAPRESDWVRTPAQPAVIASTVDQVGSRFFFRGYGVSDSMKPLHAGLVGADSLLLLDEAHLSQPFVQSVRDARRLQAEAPWSENACPAPFGVVTLSATPADAGAPFLNVEDFMHGELGRRLSRSKPSELVLYTSSSDDDVEFGNEFAERAWRFSRVGGGSGHVVAVVVNRVRRARSVFEILVAKSKAGAADVALLTGRSRPIDREEMLRDLLPRVSARRSSETGAPPLFVVATQSVEAGVDLDFDALVTEIAPLDCLRQRFGRLNRMGREVETQAAVVAARDQVAGKPNADVIYGLASRETWQMLNERGARSGGGRTGSLTIDFGVEASRRWLPDGDLLRRCLAPRADAPVMLPAFVDHWACTSPVPFADPEVALFLHGPGTGSADVSVVWRADLEPQESAEEWIERIAACPPSALEALPVPLGEARRWLAGTALGDIADVEAALDESVEGVRHALRWCGAEHEDTDFVGAEALRPGDVLVVPAGWGGCDMWGWAPGSMTPVRDRGREANRDHRGRDILRLSPRLMASTLTESDRVDPVVARSRADRFASSLETLGQANASEILDALRNSSTLPSGWVEWLHSGGRLRVIRGRGGVPLALERAVTRESSFGEPVTEDDQSVAGNRPIGLSEHSKGVRAIAAAFAESLGLPAATSEDIALAAFLHDAGKAHPQFQLWLHGGDELSAIGGRVLAKSGRFDASGMARARAGLPRGARHEVASLAIAQAHRDFAGAHDPDLVLWLIGTHHGRGRPFFPGVEWPAPGDRYIASLGDGEVRSLPVESLSELTAGWIDVQSRLSRKYGPWGLARLEALVRLADHRCSEVEQEEAP